MDLGQFQAQEKEFEWRFCTAFRAFCRLSRACIFRKTPTKATRNANSSLTVFLSASFCWLFVLWTLSHADWPLLLSVVDCLSASPFTNCRGFSRTCLSSPTSGLVGDLELRSLIGFAPKQRDRLLGAHTPLCHIAVRIVWMPEYRESSYIQKKAKRNWLQLPVIAITTEIP